MKRLFALLLCAVLFLTMLQVSALAAGPADIWEQISAIETRAAARRGASTLETRTEAYRESLD